MNKRGLKCKHCSDQTNWCGHVFTGTDEEAAVLLMDIEGVAREALEWAAKYTGVNSFRELAQLCERRGGHILELLYNSGDMLEDEHCGGCGCMDCDCGYESYRRAEEGFYDRLCSCGQHFTDDDTLCPIMDSQCRQNIIGELSISINAFARGAEELAKRI